MEPNDRPDTPERHPQLTIDADLLADISEYVEACGEHGPPSLQSHVEHLIRTGMHADQEMREFHDDPDIDLGLCPYYLKSSGVPVDLCGVGSYGPATCAFGCTDEPDCVTCEPSEGWESHQLVDVEGQRNRLPAFLARWLASAARTGQILDHMNDVFDDKAGE